MYLPRDFLTGFVEEKVIFWFGPLNTIVTFSGTSTTGLNSKLQVRLKCDPDRMGFGVSEVSRTTGLGTTIAYRTADVYIIFTKHQFILTSEHLGLCFSRSSTVSSHHTIVVCSVENEVVQFHTVCEILRVDVIPTG